MANDALAESLSQKVEKYFRLLILFINDQNMVSNDVNWRKTDFWPPNHCPIIFPTMSNVPTFSRALGHCPQLWNFSADHCDWNNEWRITSLKFRQIYDNQLIHNYRFQLHLMTCVVWINIFILFWLTVLSCKLQDIHSVSLTEIFRQLTNR